MKIHLIALASLICAAPIPVVFAQTGPDIIWTTNAHYSLRAVALSANSSTVVSAADDQTVKVWNTTNTALLRTFVMSGGHPLSVALSSDGAYATAGDGGGKTRVWRMTDGARLWIGGLDEEQVYSVCFAPDDVLLGIGRSDGINVRDAQNGSGIPFGEPPDSKVFAVCFSPEGNWLASANQNHEASLWSVAGGTLIRNFSGHSNVVNSVDFSPDEKLLATASADGTARIWNATNGVCLLVIDGGGGVARFSVDGRLLYTLDNYTFKIWRVSNGTCAGSIINSGAMKFDIAKNGKYFAYGTASGAVVLARMPLVIDEFCRTGNETILHWQGGTGLYQVLSSTNLANWQNVGSATTNTIATNVNSSTLFFRVQSLPNP